MSSAREPKRKAIGCLDLPAEIRTNIYEVLLRHYEKAGKQQKLSVAELRVRHRQLMPFLLATERIGSEVLPMLFGNDLLLLADSPTRCPRKPLPFIVNSDSPGEDNDRITVHYSTLECPNYPDKRSHEMTGGREIELPPFKWRHLFKRVKVLLRPPDKPLGHMAYLCFSPERRSIEDRDMWFKHDIDWLFPIRELASLGFGNLHLLEIEVDATDARTTVHEIKTLKTWVKERITVHNEHDFATLED